MKTRVAMKLLLSGLFYFALCLGASATANLLVNPGFETGNGSGWTTFGANNYFQYDGGFAHSGYYYYKAFGNFPSPASPNYTGIYQLANSSPGTTYSADGWVYSSSTDAIYGQDQVWLAVSFLDASSNALAVYCSPVVNATNLASFGGYDTWIDLPITNQCTFATASPLVLVPGTVTNTVANLVAPPGTAYVCYEVVFAQGTDNAAGSMYFDDLTLSQVGGTGAPATQWNLVWDDEFNLPDGSPPDPSKWGYDTGAWPYNNELEYYTTRTNNARIEGGNLIIEADQESYGGRSYTSARLKTQYKWSWTYGRMEARIKIPRGQGIWPAFWMLGTNIDSVNWPNCGEIDIMENIGNTSDQGTDHGTIHGPQNGQDYNNGVGVTGTNTLPVGTALADDFHIYAVEWTPNQVKWFLDTNNFFTATPASLPAGATWVFTAPQFLLLNVAVGGTWPGNPDSTTIFPQQMLVDYVRVYQQTPPLKISLALQPNGTLQFSWPSNIVCHLQAMTKTLGGTWRDLRNPGNPVTITPTPGEGAVFYRLASP